MTGGGFRPGAPRRLAAGRRPCGRSLLDNGTSSLRLLCAAMPSRSGMSPVRSLLWRDFASGVTAIVARVESSSMGPRRRMPRRPAFDDWRILAHLRTLAQDLSLDGESSASAVHCEPGGHYHNLGCCSGAGHHTNFLSAFLPAAESWDIKSLLPRRPRSSPPPCATTSTAFPPSSSLRRRPAP